MPSDRRVGAKLLSLVKGPWRAEGRADPTVEGTQAVKRCSAQAGHSRSDAGQADPERGRGGQLLSPERRRRCVEHVPTKPPVSERVACGVMDQPRTTQRYQPISADDEEPLTAAIVRLPGQYGRYGSRRIAALLRASLRS